VSRIEREQVPCCFANTPIFLNGYTFSSIASRVVCCGVLDGLVLCAGLCYKTGRKIRRGSEGMLLRPPS